MISLRRMRALILGQNLSSDDLHAALEASSVPVASVDCRSCPDPCDAGHDSYPARFDVDRESQMLGSVKPYRRQIVISTGKTDWDREITSTHGSLASYLSQLESKTHHSISASPPLESRIKRAPGLFDASESHRISILNGSHHTLSEDPLCETVLVFPDYKVVSEVPRTPEGAQNLWNISLDPILGRTGAPVEKSPFSSWAIPYSCVILLCSHKRRDNRCSIAAAKLQVEFSKSLEAKGWTVDTQLEHPLHTLGLPLEEFQGTSEEQESHILNQLQELTTQKKALILRNSHTGGHRYAGNCIIYTPQGSGIWYGRISTHEVDAIVTNTLEEGVILPPLLRGGVNIARTGCRTLHDW